MDSWRRLRLWLYGSITVACCAWVLASVGILPLFDPTTLTLLIFLATIVVVVCVFSISEPLHKPSPPLKGRPIALVSAGLLALELLISMLVDMSGDLPYLGHIASVLVVASVFGGYIGAAILLLRRDKRWWPYVAVGLALTLLLGPIVYAFERTFRRMLGV